MFVLDYILHQKLSFFERLLKKANGKTEVFCFCVEPTSSCNLLENQFLFEKDLSWITTGNHN